jgi:hypothetical protein
MTLQDKYLYKLITDKAFVEIFTDHYGESYFGFIIELNDDFLFLEKYTSESYSDGITILLRENITRVRWNGNKIKSIHSLLENQQPITKKNKIDIRSINSILKTVSETYNYIGIHTQDLDNDVFFIGQIIEIDNEFIVLNEFGTQISLDRKTLLLSLSDITMIEVEGNMKKE